MVAESKRLQPELEHGVLAPDAGLRSVCSVRSAMSIDVVAGAIRSLYLGIERVAVHPDVLLDDPSTEAFDELKRLPVELTTML